MTERLNEQFLEERRYFVMSYLHVRYVQMIPMRYDTNLNKRVA